MSWRFVPLLLAFALAGPTILLARPPRLALEVAIVDAEGRPVPGARFDTFPAGDVSPGLPRSTVIAFAPGRTPAAAFDARLGDRVVIALEPSRPIEGRVIDGDGSPVEGALVRLRSSIAGVAVETSALTDAHGDYSLADAPAPLRSSRDHWSEGRQIDVTAEGFAPVFLARSWRELDDDPGLPLDVVLLRGSVVRGCVRDADGGAAVAGARVFLWPTRDTIAPTVRETVALDDGTFEFANAPVEGPHDDLGTDALAAIGAVAAGYSSEVVDLPRARDGATVDVEVVLGGSAVVTGRVVDTAGQPLPKALVRAHPAHHGGRPFPPGCGDVPRPHTLSGDDGSYRLEGVRAPRSGAVSTWVAAWREPPPLGMDRHPEATATIALVAATTIHAPDVVVPRVARVDIVVTDETGRPIANAVASTWFDRAPKRTDRDGRARIESRIVREADARVGVSVRAAGYGPVVGRGFDLDQRGRVEARIALAPGRRVAGSVTTIEGQPLPGARVIVYRDRPADAKFVPEFGSPDTLAVTRADERGEFDIADLPDETLCVFASARASSAHSCTSPKLLLRGIAPDSTGVSLRLRARPGGYPTGEIIVRPLDAATGRPLRVPFQVHSGCTSSPGPDFTLIRDVPIGSRPVTVEARGYAETSEQITLTTAGARTVVEVRLEPVSAPEMTLPRDDRR